MDLDTSTYISESVLQASIARATTTTGRTSQLAAYLRLDSAAEHAGGMFSGNIELHVPSTIKQVRVGCDHNPILDDSVVLCNAWVVLTGVYKHGHQSGIFHHAQVPITKHSIQQAPSMEDTLSTGIADESNLSPEVEQTLTPKRRFGFGGRLKTRRSMSSANSDRSILPSPVGVGELDGDGNMVYQLQNSKAIIPFRISVDPRLPNSFSCDGGEIGYWLSIVFHCDQYTMQDSVAFEARQVNVYQMESFIAADTSSSLSSTSSKVDMGGPGKLEVAAWLASPSFGVVEGTEAKITMMIRNFTKKKTQGIKLELFRTVKSSIWDGSKDNVKKVAEEVYSTDDSRFEPGFCAHVTVGIHLPVGLYSSNGIPEISVHYSIKASILIPLSDSIVVDVPVRIVRPYSFPEGTLSKRLPEPPISVGTQTIEMEKSERSDSVTDITSHEDRLLAISQDLETLLADSTISNDPQLYYYTTSSDDETMSIESMSDSGSDDSETKQAYYVRAYQPTYTFRGISKPRKPSAHLTLDTTGHRYQSSYDSQETHNAGLTSDSSRFSHWPSQYSASSPRTPVGEIGDEQHSLFRFRTMSAPSLSLLADEIPIETTKRLSNHSLYHNGDYTTSNDDIKPYGHISRRKHIRAIPWRSGFDETTDEISRN
ncbi:hypothetical protein BC943DRAFT_9264 [Umbelopsis sp. AD052]|nr:hypothetical protein BC943DRAFT_9264 [Umbelopsis sp. AD052]